MGAFLFHAKKVNWFKRESVKVSPVVCDKWRSHLQRTVCQIRSPESLLTLCHVLAGILHGRASRSDALELSKHEPGKTERTWWWFTVGTDFLQERWSPHPSRSLQSSKQLPCFHRITFCFDGNAFHDTLRWSCSSERPSGSPEARQLPCVAGFGQLRCNRPAEGAWNPAWFFLRLNLCQLDWIKNTHGKLNVYTSPVRKTFVSQRIFWESG